LESAPRTTTLTMRWDGTNWETLPSPNVGSGHNQLYAVSMHGPKDVWAVGAHWHPATGLPSALSMHWNGSAWTAHAVHVAGAARSGLEGVVNLGTNGAWAVGEWDTATGTRRPLVVHWNGSTWSVIPTPETGGTSPSFWAIAGHAGDLWAVGAHAVKGVAASLI